MQRSVTLIERGREGQVLYTEGLRSITGSQEFGGGDVVAIVSMGSEKDWRHSHGWALVRRSQILRYIAEEVIRQRAPSCAAEIDESSGDILLRRTTDGLTPKAADVSWVRRLGDLRGRLALLGLAAVAAFATGALIKTCVVSVQSTGGAPVGSTVRSDTHLATLISELQPYTHLQADGYRPARAAAAEQILPDSADPTTSDSPAAAGWSDRRPW